MVRDHRTQLTALMTRLAAGERAAFHPLYEEVWPLVKAYAQRQLCDAAEAEDVAQRALLKVFALATRFDPDREALPWILGIAANESRNAKSKRSRRRVADPPSEAPASEALSPEDAAIRQDLIESAVLVVGELGPKDIETIMAAVGIGRRPDIAGATFRKRLERGLARLRSAWRAQHGAE